MSASSDVVARYLASEIESRTSQLGFSLDPEARDHLIFEFSRRLDASTDAQQLARRWENNLDQYINRAVARGISPGTINKDFISHEFQICGEICPPP
jgi:hypothetical protein